MRYRPSSVCSSAIDIEVDGDVIRSVAFTGGCHGNLQGISKLVEGMKVEDAISRLKGIRCGFKNTSCPDQLAQALESLNL
ncbi:MAG: TIGR03905 family TSCPD domain-containing protein [Lachnospiraceae bacterium]|nr:TIGR03905 family TSCPD domain-containing protein [Lachnospiraceae bacterium]